MQKRICLNNTKSTLSSEKSIDSWNDLKEEVIMAKNGLKGGLVAKNVHHLKEKLNKYIYGDRTTRV